MAHTNNNTKNMKIGSKRNATNKTINESMFSGSIISTMSTVSIASNVLTDSNDSTDRIIRFLWIPPASFQCQ